uniref:Uncharacterized protein n=1 Tax=Salix viminalis TaxID=40686 RepID=A0A6N2NH40_SALVM
MDFKDMVEHGMKKRSFCYEEYHNRRVFLRSHPIRCGAEDKTMASTTNKNTENKPIKMINSRSALRPCGPNSAGFHPFLLPLGN